jgi:thiol-disulfide isomerase/thioredoxin
MRREKMRNTIIIHLMIIIIILSGCTSNTNNTANSIFDNSTQSNEIGDIFVYEAGKVKVYFFWGDGCPHCKTQMQFFERIQSKYPEMEIYMFETYKNQSNVKLFYDISAKYGATPRAVPATFIGDKMWVGFASIVEKEIEQKIEYCKTNICKILE